jgi:endonuclease-3
MKQRKRKGKKKKGRPSGSSGGRRATSGRAASPAAGRPPAPARLQAILSLLDAHYPQAVTALRFDNPYEILVATILSAQCTDERVNKVTPVLFKAAPDPAALHALEAGQVEEIIRSTGFYRNKTKSLKGAAKLLVERFDGRVPDSMEELRELPGVARKTANVVLGSAFGRAAGVVVDTHVRRVSGRLGLTPHTQPDKIERDLMALLEKERWIRFSHQLIRHGRQVCKARKPQCERCFLAAHCPAAAIASDD